MPDKKHKFDEKVEQQLAKIVIDNEYAVAQANQGQDIEDFQSYLDMFDAIRSEKDYDWMSDIFIPEFPSHMLTQSSIDVAQYFQTRDFVEVYVMDKSDEATAAADSTKELVNKSLNRRGLYHYQKYVRGKLLNHLVGSVWAECWWEQDIKQNLMGYQVNEETGLDDETKGVYDYEIRKDHFNYDILDPRNVFTDNTYKYSAQDKDWIIIRSETNLQKLQKEAERNGYFNLNLLKSVKAEGTSDTKTETTDKDNPQMEYLNKIGNPWDKLKRYGKHWVKDGKPGIDEDGEILDGATLEEVVMTFIKKGSDKILIGFNEQQYMDTSGNPYRPVIRGICYVHPTKDAGAGDGKYARELQIGINDTFNLGNDRTRLATIPTMKGKKYVTEDSDSIYFEPGHVMELEDPTTDLMEFKIQDNIQGALQQLGVLTNKMQQATSIFPTTMGDMPNMASTTATAVAGAESQTGKRTNYKSMSFEYTFLCELYWMIQQMTYSFAKPETGAKLMGAKVYNFNPNYDFYFKPLSQSIETDQAKAVKIQRWTTVLQTVVQINHPDAVKLVNFIMGELAELMGKEFANFADKLLNQQIPIQTQSAGTPEGQTDINAPSNQNMIPQGAMQAVTRGAIGG